MSRLISIIMTGHLRRGSPSNYVTINGMLSVNAATTQLWYYSWHGRFLDKADP
jgi:hypothetical protein